MDWLEIVKLALIVALVVGYFIWMVPRWKQGWQMWMRLFQMAERQASTKPPILSPDGMWWWDGQGWQPTNLQSHPPQEPPA